MDILERMDPELAAVFSRLPPVDHSPDSRELLAARYAEQNAAGNPLVERTNRLVPGPPDSDGVTVRTYEPRDRAGVLPAILFLHGGGFIIGKPEHFDFSCDEYAEGVGAIVVSPDYRL